MAEAIFVIKINHMQTRNNYNTVASFYDHLSGLIFGQELKKPQIDSLQFITKDSNILIVGGGTGWILEKIADIYSSGLRITYVDSSSKMIELSKRRNTKFNSIEFIHASIEDVNLLPQKYDLILTPFFFDGFSQSTSLLVFKKLDESLKVNGRWIYIDFYISEKSNYRQRILLKLMYVFFRYTCKIEAKELPVIAPYFLSYKIQYSKSYFKNFIIMQVFQKKQ